MSGTSIKTFFDSLDGKLQGAVVLWMMWLTTSSLSWAHSFAQTASSIDGIHLAAIIGSVMAPLTALQAAIFKFYVDSRNAVKAPE